MLGLDETGNGYRPALVAPAIGDVLVKARAPVASCVGIGAPASHSETLFTESRVGPTMTKRDGCSRDNRIGARPYRRAETQGLASWCRPSPLLSLRLLIGMLSAHVASQIAEVLSADRALTRKRPVAELGCLSFVGAAAGLDLVPLGG